MKTGFEKIINLEGLSKREIASILLSSKQHSSTLYLLPKDCSSLFLDEKKSVGNGDNWDLSKVENTAYMFANTRKANPDTSNWDVSNVEDMSSMFSGARKANPDVSNWNVGKVKNMSSMFDLAKKADPEVSNWDVGKVEDMSAMFSDAKKANPDVGNWRVASVSNMSSMFDGAEIAIPDVSRWDVSSVKDMSGMFSKAKNANPDVSNWSVGQVEDMAYMFDDAEVATPDVSRWDVSQVKKMTWMFRNAKKANPDISNWDVRNIEEIRWLYQNIVATPDINGWDLNALNASTMQTVFINARVVKPDINRWPLTEVRRYHKMFIDADFNERSFPVENKSEIRAVAETLPGVDRWIISDLMRSLSVVKVVDVLKSIMCDELRSVIFNYCIESFLKLPVDQAKLKLSDLRTTNLVWILRLYIIDTVQSDDVYNIFFDHDNLKSQFRFCTLRSEILKKENRTKIEDCSQMPKIFITELSEELDKRSKKRN